MMGRRRGRPSVIGSAARTAGRTAVIVGTANAVTQKQAGRAMAAAQQAQPAAAAPAGLTMDEKLDQLKKLGELRDAGVLSEAEFEVKKHAVLNG
jgi:hypothetical protein